MNSRVKTKKDIFGFCSKLNQFFFFLFIEHATNAVQLQHKEHINHNIKAIKDDHAA